MVKPRLNSKLRDLILEECNKIASSREIVAAYAYGPYIYGCEGGRCYVDVLLVVKPHIILRCYLRHVGDLELSILMVDKRTFERDIEDEWFGGLITENLITPYEPLINGAYIFDREIYVKKRMILELLNSLILEYPEMSSEIMIAPEYFLYEVMVREASLFPPLTYRFLNLLREDVKARNVGLMMRGFRKALDLLINEGILEPSGEYLLINRDYIRKIREKRLFPIDLRSIRRRIIRHILRAPKLARSLLRDQEIYYGAPINFERVLEPPTHKLEDPKRYLFISTPLGLVSLSDKVTIEDFLRKILPKDKPFRFDIEKIGGALNTVYLLNLRVGDHTERMIVKVFKDWYSFKWFPLALWALGARGFSVLGKSRLEREYAINKFLSTHGIRVPKILYVSPGEKLIFEEYVDGISLIDVIRQIVRFKSRIDVPAKVIRKVGKEIAEIHNLDVALGDCKPENLIITIDGDLCFVDLEQASRGGDQAWDIAEFLYYSGHYLPSLSTEAAKIITKEFISGYLEAGGKIKNLKRAMSLKYMRVFGFFTQPSIILAIYSAYRETLKRMSRD